MDPPANPSPNRSTHRAPNPPTKSAANPEPAPTSPPVTSPAERSGRRRSVILLVAVVLVGLSLRGPLIAIAPVTGQVRAGLHIGSATAGLFTSIPVLLFALAAPPALWLLVRAGLDRVMPFALLGIAFGTLIRSVGGLPVALTGTVVLGFAVGVGNVAAPVAVGRDFPGRSGPVTGVYTASLNLGSMLVSLLTAPLADLVGWRWALASWSAIALVAAAVWWVVGRRVRPNGPVDQHDADSAGSDAFGSDAAADEPGTAMWRRPVALLLTMAFACQSFGYYGITAWLPSLLADERGLSRAGAGFSSSVFQVLGIVGAVGVPYLLHRGFSRRAVVIGMCACWAVLPVGLIVAPAGWPLWCAFGGAAQGAGITIIFILVLAQVDSVGERQRMSTLVQGLGYALGATGPTVIGAVHQATGSWTAPLLVIATALAGLTACAVFAATIGRRPATVA